MIRLRDKRSCVLEMLSLTQRLSRPYSDVAEMSFAMSVML